MHNPLARRQFLARTLFAGASVLLPQSHAADPTPRPGKPRFLLSLAAYSFRDYFRAGQNPAKEKAKSGPQIDLFQFIDYCADHQCHGTELTSYYFPQDPTDEFLLRLKRHAFMRGIDISGTAVGNNFTVSPGPKRDQQIASVKTWIDRAAVLSAPHIRVFAGANPDVSEGEAKRLCIEALKECCEYAGKKGIMLGLENHGGIVAEAGPLIEIVREVNSPWLGINLDGGNFHTADPYGDLAQCVPYAVNVQFKVEVAKKGQPKEAADMDRFFEILRSANYQGYVALEYEAAADPWQAIPALLSRMKQFCM